MKRRIFGSLVILGSLIAALFAVAPAAATNDCVFDINGMVMTLTADCITDETIFIEDGFTLDGAKHTITAVDPDGGFLGAVVQNAGTTAHVINLTVTADGLANLCKDAGPPDNRLRGIMFDGASGSITKSVVTGINKGASGCQEGNAIEVRNAPFDGTHPNTQTVEISHNTVVDFQKTGILANGDVEVNIHHNKVGDSATQGNLAANSIQVGFGGQGVVAHNQIDGSQWLGSSSWGATAVLIFDSGAVEVSQNNIGGNSDIGIAIDNSMVGLATVNNNKLSDSGPDGANGDYGIVDYNGGNAVSNNKVKGFDYPYFGVDGGKNKSKGGPQKDSPAW